MGFLRAPFGRRSVPWAALLRAPSCRRRRVSRRSISLPVLSQLRSASACPSLLPTEPWLVESAGVRCPFLLGTSSLLTCEGRRPVCGIGVARRVDTYSHLLGTSTPRVHNSTRDSKKGNAARPGSVRVGGRASRRRIGVETPKAVSNVVQIPRSARDNSHVRHCLLRINEIEASAA